MNKTLGFITGSRYDGTFNDALHIMDGFGCYIFPDGTEYRGYLKHGKFHGYGILRMGPPNRFVFKGQFEMGELSDIDTMTFADGLHLKGHFDDVKNKLITKNWRYCCEKDRRYSTELHLGMEPVGPNSYITRQRPPRQLVKGTYDTEEGIFKESTHFLAEIPPPFYHMRFVSCTDEVKWIKKHCRKGRQTINLIDDKKPPPEPEAKVCYHIIDTNIKAMMNLGENRNICGCNEFINRKQRLPELCPKVLLPVKDSLQPIADDDEGDLAKTPSTESCNTLSDNTLIEDIEHNILIEMRDLKIPSDCGNLGIDGSLLIDARKSSVFFN